MPLGTSTRPVLEILPTSENILVPLLFLVPVLLNQSEPLLIIRGTFAQVSTLLRLVGFPQSPCSEVCTYLARGSPTLPSSEAIKAVDSPQIKAPPPRFMRTLKLNPEPRILSPSKPQSVACLI